MDRKTKRSADDKAAKKVDEKYLHDVESFLLTQKVEREFALTEGKEIGRAEGVLAVARNMKSMNMPTDIIANATGLSESQIAEL